MSSDDRRLSRGDLFMAVARLYGDRSSCPRANVGTVAVMTGRVVASGYVGAPTGQRHCLEVGCDIGPDGGCQRSVHAEANLVAWAARTGTPLLDTEIYTTFSPCLACAKLLANAGIKGLVYETTYRDPSGLYLLEELRVVIAQYPNILVYPSTIETFL